MGSRLRFLALLSALLLLAAACTGSDGTPFDSSQDGGSGTAGTSGGSDNGDSGGSDGGGSDDDDGDGFGGQALPQPGPLFQGLAEYDSYRMSLSFTLGGGPDTPPTSTDISVDYSAADGGWRMSLVSDDGTGPTTQETFWKGGAGCSFDGFEWAPLAFSLEERDLYGALWAGFDLAFKARSPEFVGDETIAGVGADHYTAEVAGLGAVTGGVASDSRVDYWLAKDGGALIGYEATVETSTGPAGDPSSEVVSLDIVMTTSDLNQPVAITPPPECPVGPEAPGGGGGDGEAVILPGLVETLGTYDSYRFAFDTVFGSPSLGGTEASIELAVARDGTWSLTIGQVVEGEATTSAQYFDGETLCQFDGFEYSADPIAEEQSDIFGAISQQVDFVPVVRNPRPEGTEMVAGMEATRFTFDVAGIGLGTSTVAGGEYWITDDDQLLRYRVDLTASAPDGTQIDGSLGLSLDELNGDVLVVIPPECAAVVTPPTETTVTGDTPPPTETSGTINASGAFEATEALGAFDIQCSYGDGLIFFQATGPSGFEVGGLVFDAGALAPGLYEMDDAFSYAPFGTPLGDSGTLFERATGGPGIGDLIIESVSPEGNSMTARFEANLESSPPSTTVTVFGSFSCPVVAG